MSDYNTAIDNCNNYGGILASITNINELENAMSVCDVYTGCWFGLNKRSSNWLYIDGSYVGGTLGFDNIGNMDINGYPWNITDKTQINDCVQLSKDGWNTKECSKVDGIPLCIKNPPKSCGININNLKVWYKGALNDISNNGYNAINTNGDIYRDISDNSVYGDVNSSFIIPYNINATSHTIIYVAKYNGNNKERILTSSNDTNYLAGFWKGNEGVCYQGNWITTNITNNINDFNIITSYPNGCNANSNSVSNNNDAWIIESNPGTFNIGINIYNNEKSNWKLYELMIFDVILSPSNIACIESYLFNERRIHKTTIPPITFIPSQTPTHNIETTIPPITLIPSHTPTHNIQTTSTLPTETPTSVPTETPTSVPTPITPKNTNNNSINVPLTAILIAGFAALGCCLVLFIVIYVLSKQIYNAKNEEAIKKEEELASLGYNGNIGSDISNNENIVIKGIKPTKMSNLDNNISRHENENNNNNEIETNDTQIIYESNTTNKMRSIGSLQIEGSIQVKTIKV